MAILVTEITNIRYLCGFTGTAGMLLVYPADSVLFTDNRYAEIARADLLGRETQISAHTRERQANALIAALRRASVLLFESTHMTVDFYQFLQRELPGVPFLDSNRIIEHLRLVKDAGEIARMTSAANIAANAFAQAVPLIEHGISERKFALQLETTMRDMGADSAAFPSVVAAGPNASKPHAAPTDREIGAGELVVVDFGAAVDGYQSDMARTVWYGELDNLAARVYRSVLDANAAGVEAVISGVPHAAVDNVCRTILQQHGFADSPVHPSGHNIGLNVHELPYLSATSQEPLRAQQVITVEPGVYLNNACGARVEDMLIVLDDRNEVLTKMVSTWQLDP